MKEIYIYREREMKGETETEKEKEKQPVLFTHLINGRMFSQISL